jgi:HK97 family phage prohead protease
MNTTGFQYGGKASNVYELSDGDLIIEGFAADFSGVDREDENFTDGAFQRGIKSFLDGPASLCYHHKHAMVLGKVLNLEEVPGRGLKMRARIDGAIKNHPELGVIYEQIKRGTLTALSVGGFFKRKLTNAGHRICDVDFTEISVTGVPVHTGPAFAVVAGKALQARSEALEVIESELAMIELRATILSVKQLTL